MVYQKILKCWKFYEYKKIGYYRTFLKIFYCLSRLRQVTPFFTTDESDTDELGTVLVDLKNISDVTDKGFVKKLIFDKWDTKVNVKEGTIYSATDLINERFR